VRGIIVYLSVKKSTGEKYALKRLRLGDFARMGDSLPCDHFESGADSAIRPF
jgi:hypothetical protein